MKRKSSPKVIARLEALRGWSPPVMGTGKKGGAASISSGSPGTFLLDPFFEFINVTGMR
jgi:hypothetical protein